MKMQKTKYRVVLCFLLIIASICVVGCGKKKNNSKENSDNKKLTEHQEAWIKDLDGTFRETLAKSAGVTENMTDDERNQRIDEIIDNIKTKDLNDDEVVYSIRKLISDFKIAHMDFTRSDEYCTEDDNLDYPLSGKWFGDDYYIVASTEEYKQYIGQRLIAINGMKLDDVLKAYDDRYSNETDSWLKRCFENYNNLGFGLSDLKYLGIIDKNVKDVTFTLNDGTKENDIVVKPITITKDTQIHLTSIFENMDKLPMAYDVNVKANSAPFTYVIDTDHRAVYFQYNQCTDMTTMGGDSKYPNFDEFFGNMIKDMQSKEGQFDCFVIDLRMNTGGSEMLYNNAVEKYGEYLNQYPIKVLMGMSTFSAGVDAVDMTLHSFDNVTLYGEETGLAVHNYTDVKNTILKNTGCELNTVDHLDFSYAIDKRGQDIKKGVLPDVEVVQDYNNFINGLDDVYLKAVE